MKPFVLFLLLTSFICSAQLKSGIWRGVLFLNPNERTELPFNFEIKTVKGKYQLIIHNAQERIVVNETILKKDSFNFKMPVFDTEFKTKIIGDSILTGVWINHTKKENKTIAFTAKYGNSMRFLYVPGKPDKLYEGKWEVTFSPGSADSSKAIGLFKHKNESAYVDGTFLTETGDYRYLEGMIHNGMMYLSCFDGSHAFLFVAENNGEDINKADFYSGSTWHESWMGKRNDSFKLQNPESLTYLKDSTKKINFSFYNIKDQKISLDDAKFKDKVVIIQVMGSWCPNCMDESAYLSEVYKKYNKKGLEIIALAYERTADKERAKTNLTRLTKRFDIGYDILLTGFTGKEKASESLPFLNKVMAFPTTIILDKQHKVKTVYTGFSGPATGKAYEDYTQKTEELISELLSRK
ncbi:MAG: TlpA family protein disulfide reductase [Burkholderiales bacterium]|nr:TlpA family protein disulfide reductase [Bacteroidia bacterium]